MKYLSGPRLAGICGSVLLASLIGTSVAVADEAGQCEVRLTVELTPDVPNASTGGFLSSLLSNRVKYELTLLQEDSDSVIVVDLTGPGPDYRCRNAIEAIRRDGRVLSVHVDQEFR
ncbi:MAG: hypothetical protein JWM63_2516 [Gammaproteobacteria bacterium]|jgi:hypothetical protein|nr:hypothetical protein [Gammaproteobacteria bacterium]